MSTSLEALTEVNLDDLVEAFGWKETPVAAALLRRVFRAPARKFARWMLDFDRQVGQEDLAVAARALLGRTVRGVEVYGRENLPASGPILILSNHPGMADTLCLFAAIGRADLRIIALRRPFLRSLPNVSRHLFYVSDEASDRLRAIRQTAAHLRAGGAVLTFPAGKIEPDPHVYVGAIESLQGWTDSAVVFLRFAAETLVLPVLVRGVLWEKAVRHPLTRLKRERLEREKLGAALQLLAQTLFDLRPVTPSVHFGRPLRAAELAGKDAARLHAAVLDEMRRLIRETGEQQ